MKLISTKKTKRNIALMFVFAFTLSNMLSLFGPSAKAAVLTTVQNSGGTCFQHTGSVANGSLVTVYNLGTITITSLVSEISPANDAGNGADGEAGIARATNAGAISTAGDVIGNAVSLVPPTGTNFVIVPGFQSTADTSLIAASNATITNAQSVNATPAAADLGISVGVVVAGTAGIGRAIIAIAKDSGDTYPNTNTGGNTANISITGLGIAIPPSAEGSLSGNLQVTFAGPPDGANNGALTISAIQNFATQTGINICTVTSPSGQLEAISDGDDSTATDTLFNSTSATNFIGLGQIAANTSFTVTDQATSASGATVDLEPIVIRGKAGTGKDLRDQVFGTSAFTNVIDTTAELSPGGINTATYFPNFTSQALTLTFDDGNSTAMTTLNSVDIIIGSSAGSNNPTGFSTSQVSRKGFLGALRAAVISSGNTATNAGFTAPGAVASGTWGVASIVNNTLQESAVVSSNTSLMSANGATDKTSNAAVPNNNNFVDLKITCGTDANAAGWFAILNSGTSVFGTGNAGVNQQSLYTTKAGTKTAYPSAVPVSTLFTQSLTKLTNVTYGADTVLDGGRSAAAGDTTVANNVLLYATCDGNGVLQILPVQNAFDADKDAIGINPKLTISNVSNTFTSDLNITATVSGNNLSGSTTLTLARALGAITTSGGDSGLVVASGVALSEGGHLGIDCPGTSPQAVTLANVTGSSTVQGSVDLSASQACTSGTVAPAPSFFTGGKEVSQGPTGTILDGAPVVQGEGRGVLIKELSVTGFNELLTQVGGGSAGTVFEVQLPSGCDLVDDLNDNGSAAAAGGGGNDVSRIVVQDTAGIDATVANGTGSTTTQDAQITNANVLVQASGAEPAKIHFSVYAATGTGADAQTLDAVLVKLDAQDILCPSTVADGTALTGLVRAQNKVTSPTLTKNLGTVNFGTANKALVVGFADDSATSTKGEKSTNSMIGSTPRLSSTAGGGITTSHPIKVAENTEKGFPIGGRVSRANLDPDNQSSSTLVITKGQVWIIPNDAAAFSAAPAEADVSFSDDSLTTDGAPSLVTSSSVDANAPVGTLIVPIKKNPAGSDPSTKKTTVTIKNAKIVAAQASASDLTASVEFYSQDAGVIVNTPGVASVNSAAAPTLFTPYTQASTKANTQINAAGVQVNGQGLSNSLLTSRLTTLGTPQISSFAKVVSAVKDADATKITASAAAVAVSSSGAPSTDNVVTVTGAAGAVDAGAQVTVATGTYDSVTVVAADDGSFTAKVRGNCATTQSISVTATSAVSTKSSATVTKSILCNSGGKTAEDVKKEIAGADGKATIAEVLEFIKSKGGLAALISNSDQSLLQGAILAAKEALKLT